MRAEDLFAAIGSVEESRLARTELSVPSRENQEDKTMKIRPTRIIRNFFIAVVIVSMLAVTAYAVTGYLIFDSPEEMVASIFGDQTGFDHNPGSIQPDPNGPPTGIIVEPTFDRVPADEAVVAEDVAPYVDPVGQSISWEGYTLMIDANLYDASTKCGLVTYTLESDDPLGYSLQSDGKVWFSTGGLVGFNQYGYSYIIQDQSSDTKLTAIFYYQLRNPESSDLVITLSERAGRSQEEEDRMIEELKQQLRQEIPEEEALAFQKEYVGDSWPWFEQNRTREENIESAYEAWAYQRLEAAEACPDQIVIPETVQEEMSSITLGDGAVTLSPIAVTIREDQIENLGHSFMGLMKVKFADGTEYVVQDGYISNYVFNVSDDEGKAHTYMFNRIIDISKVTSVVVDGGVELLAD